MAAAQDGLAFGKVEGHVVVAEKGATVVIGEAPVKMTAVDRESALGRYLQHVISRNRYLQLQGIRSGGRLVNIELDRIFIRLRATRQREVTADERWLAEEAVLAPGSRCRRPREPLTTTETVAVSVEEALAQARHLAVLGDPGSGKTTLLRSLESERIPLPEDFFDPWLAEGRAAILLDGLDEVADPDLRRRVSRLAESFTRAYPDCRYVVTNRIVGYSGPARLGREARHDNQEDEE